MITLKEKFRKQQERKFSGTKLLFETSNEKYINWLEKRVNKKQSKNIDLDKLTPLELHQLLYNTLEKLEKLPYVYDKKNKVTHNNYFASNTRHHHDAREEIETLIDKYGNT